MMTLETIFFGCFLFGLLFTCLAFFGGMGHFHLGHMHLHAGHSHSHIGWINGYSMAAFLCWFGGIGYLLMRAHSYATVVVVFFAIAAGFTGAAVISAFFTRVLLRFERPLLPEDTEMRGVLARVSGPVRAGGTGEILFSLNGTRRCAAARADDGRPLPKGLEVVVTDFQRGIASVIPFHDATQDRSA
jgi:hypothetical protein